MSDEAAHQRRRLNPAWAGPLVLLLLISLAYFSAELVQRHRFTVMKEQVEAVVAELQNVTYEFDLVGTIAMREDGKGGTNKVATGGHEHRISRSAVWFISFVVPNPSKPSGRSLQNLLSLTLVQERHWILGSPSILVDLSRLCQPTIYALVTDKLRARGLSYQQLPGF